MSLDLTKKFIADYRAMEQEVEALKLRLAGSEPGLPVSQSVGADPQEIERLTNDLTNVRTELEGLRRQHVLKDESQRVQSETQLALALREFEQRKTNDQQRISELEQTIKMLRTQASQLPAATAPPAPPAATTPPAETAPLRFEDAFPKEAEDLRKARDHLRAYRSRFGMI